MARTPVARRRSRAKKKPSEEMTEEEIREKQDPAYSYRVWTTMNKLL
jgi:hypothetical protein